MAEAIYGVFTRAFWKKTFTIKFTPSGLGFHKWIVSRIAEIADSLGTVLTEHFFDEEILAASLEPFIAILRSTPTAENTGSGPGYH